MSNYFNFGKVERLQVAGFRSMCCGLALLCAAAALLGGLRPAGAVEGYIVGEPTPPSGTYRIMNVSNGKMWVWAGQPGGDKLISTRTQPNDDYSRFKIVQLKNGAGFQIYTVIGNHGLNWGKSVDCFFPDPNIPPTLAGRDLQLSTVMPQGGSTKSADGTWHLGNYKTPPQDVQQQFACPDNITSPETEGYYAGAYYFTGPCRLTQPIWSGAADGIIAQTGLKVVDTIYQPKTASDVDEKYCYFVLIDPNSMPGELAPITFNNTSNLKVKLSAIRSGTSKGESIGVTIMPKTKREFPTTIGQRLVIRHGDTNEVLQTTVVTKPRMLINIDGRAQSAYQAAKLTKVTLPNPNKPVSLFEEAYVAPKYVWAAKWTGTKSDQWHEFSLTGQYSDWTPLKFNRSGLDVDPNAPGALAGSHNGYLRYFAIPGVDVILGLDPQADDTSIKAAAASTSAVLYQAPDGTPIPFYKDDGKNNKVNLNYSSNVEIRGDQRWVTITDQSMFNNGNFVGPYDGTYTTADGTTQKGDPTQVGFFLESLAVKFTNVSNDDPQVWSTPSFWPATTNNVSSYTRSTTWGGNFSLGAMSQVGGDASVTNSGSANVDDYRFVSNMPDGKNPTFTWTMGNCYSGAQNSTPSVYDPNQHGYSACKAPAGAVTGMLDVPALAKSSFAVSACAVWTAPNAAKITKDLTIKIDYTATYRQVHMKENRRVLPQGIAGLLLLAFSKGYRDDQFNGYQTIQVVQKFSRTVIVPKDMIATPWNTGAFAPK